MNRSILSLLVFMTCAFTAAAVSAKENEKPVFGPKQYDVKERYGIENRYQETFSATEDVYLIKIQNSEKNNGRVEYIDFTLNGRKLLDSYNYRYPFIGAVAKLARQNSFDVALRDALPSGDRRPQLPPRFIVLSVERITVKLPEGVYGVLSSDKLRDLSEILQKIKEPESYSLAVAALSLGNDLTARAEAVRKLSSRKDASTFDFHTYLFNDFMLHPDIKGEAALSLGAIGDRKSIPLLVQGVVDDEDTVRMGSARALSFYSEDDTREQVLNTFKKLDVTRLRPVVQTVSESGWKPISAIVSLAASSDPYVANIGIRLLGAVKDPKATEHLLKLFDEPGQGDFTLIIDSLGASKDKRAVAPLSRMAADREERIGFEVALANALASLGDQASAPLIEDIINNTKRQKVKLRAAYKKLTGRDYKK